MKTKYPIFIGSKNRINLPIKKLFTGAYLFVEPQDYENYNKEHGNDFIIVKLEKNDMGFGYLLNQMQKFAKENNFKYYMFCDDDILGLMRKDKSKCHIDEIYEYCFNVAENNNYSQVMVSFVAHNWYEKKEIKENIGAWCMFLNNTSMVESVGEHDEQLKIYNDWYISAMLIKSKFKNACIYNYMFNHKMKSQKGGAENIYKKQSILDNARDYLINKFGKHCIKEVEAHGQKEIRFIWRNINLVVNDNQQTLF